MPNNDNQIILQFIDRIVDENIRSAEALTALKFAIQEQRAEISEVLDMLKNELRRDMKDHIDKKSDLVRDEMIRQLESIEGKFDILASENKKGNDRNEQIDKVLTDIRKKGLWLRGVVVVAASLATLAAAALYFSRVTGIASDKSSPAIVQPDANNGSP